jgi:hypothetical protein
LVVLYEACHDAQSLEHKVVHVNLQGHSGHLQALCISFMLTYRVTSTLYKWYVDISVKHFVIRNKFMLKLVLFVVKFDKSESGVTLCDVCNTLSTVVTYIMSLIACF